MSLTTVIANAIQFAQALNPQTLRPHHHHHHHQPSSSEIQTSKSHFGPQKGFILDNDEFMGIIRDHLP